MDWTMKKEDFLKLGFTEEQAEKAAEASAEELKGFIPKVRFDEVNNSKKQLEADIKTRDEQLEALKAVDAEGLKAEIEKLQGENKTAKEKYEADLKKIQIDNAVEKALMGAKAKNIKAVKALLDLENAELDGESIKGLDDQLKKLQEGEDSKFLFEATDTKNQNIFKGIKPGEKKDGTPGQGTSTTLADALKAHYSNNE
jgi:vancomycin resistance protein YoaR